MSGRLIKPWIAYTKPELISILEENKIDILPGKPTKPELVDKLKDIEPIAPYIWDDYTIPEL